MSDTQRMVRATLEEIAFSIELILERFVAIHSSDDFLEDTEGLEKLDSISMRLIAIGEGFKNIDKLTDKKLLPMYPDIDWRGVMGVRDILSHHYFQMDAETIYEICDEHLESLLRATKNMLDKKES